MSKEAWISHSSLSQSKKISIRSDYTVGEAIKETERIFSFAEKALLAKFDGRTLYRDSSVPTTTSQNPLELFEGKHVITDGLPPISRVRYGKCTTTTNSDHEEATIAENVFERLSVNTEVPVLPLIWNKHNFALAVKRKELGWSSEGSVTAYVREVLEELFCVEKFKELTCYEELSLFNAEKPDIVVICEFGIPVGVLEVKTSSSTGGTTPLSKGKVLGQIFDYLVHLKNYTGRRDVFGILTTYHEWRIVWLPESDDSAKSKTTVATSRVQGPMAQLPSRPPNWSRVDDESNQFPALNIPQDGVEMERHLHGTGIIEWNDPNLPHILLSVLQKMKSSPMQNAVSYFRLYPKRSYMYLDQDRFRWETVDKELTPCVEGRVPSHFQHAFLLADLGGGGDGRVWLACTGSCKVCVLKFSTNGRNQQLQKEKQVWKEVWNCDVIIKQLNKRPVLVMPWVKPCSEDEFHSNEEVQVAVKDAIKVMANAGYRHDDLNWRHVGLYRKDDKLHALLFDLSRTTRINRDQVEDTISQMMSELSDDYNPGAKPTKRKATGETSAAKRKPSNTDPVDVETVAKNGMLSKLTVAQLKEYLTSVGKKPSGRKPDLINAIIEHLGLS